jgi:hypothetical protein
MSELTLQDWVLSSPIVHEAIIPRTVTFFTLLDAVNADLQPISLLPSLNSTALS